MNEEGLGPAPVIPPRPERTKSIYTKPVDPEKRASMIATFAGIPASVPEEGIPVIDTDKKKAGKEKTSQKTKMSDEEVMQKLRCIVRLVYYPSDTVV